MFASDFITGEHSVKNETFRYDYVFSNWIFVWFLFYYLGAVPFSPLLTMFIGLVCNTYEFLSKKKDVSFAWQKDYILWNINIKVLPAIILLLSKTKIHWIKDLLFMLLVYALFLFWGFVNGRIGRSRKAKSNFNFNEKDQQPL